MPCALTVRQRHDWGKRRWHLHMCITEAIRSHCRVTAHTRIIVVARATEQPASKRRATTRRLPPIQALDYHTGNSDRHGCRCTRHKLRAATLRRRWSCFAVRPRLSLRDGRPAGRRRRELLQRRRRNVCGRAEAQLHAAHACLVPRARAAVALSHQQSTPRNCGNVQPMWRNCGAPLGCEGRGDTSAATVCSWIAERERTFRSRDSPGSAKRQQQSQKLEQA